MKRRFWVKGISVALVLFGLTGCSTMFGRQHDEQEVFFDSNVPGVEVNCSGRRTKTPGAMPLKQSTGHSCVAEREGYERKVFKVPSGLSWSGFAHSTALNTAATGWWTMGIGTGIGWLVDFASGSMKNIKKESVFLEMAPVQNEARNEKASG